MVVLLEKVAKRALGEIKTDYFVAGSISIIALNNAANIKLFFFDRTCSA